MPIITYTHRRYRRWLEIAERALRLALLALEIVRRMKDLL